MPTVRPIADSFLDGWTPSAGATAWEVLDDNDDADYVESSSTDNQVNCQLDTLTDPASSSDHILRFRVWRSTDSGPALTVGLWVGDPATTGTLIANVALSDAEILSTETWETYELTLSGPEADSITDYGDLYVQATNGNPTTWRLGWVEFEVPESIASFTRLFHLQPGSGVRDWDFHGKIDSFTPLLTEAFMSEAWVECEVQVSAATGYIDSGFRIVLRAAQDFYGAQSTTLVLEMPARGLSIPLTLGASIVTDDVRVLLVNANPVCTDCENWVTGFGGLRLFIDEVEHLESGDWVIPAGSYALSGSGYDGRLNITTMIARDDNPRPSFGGVGCGFDSLTYEWAADAACRAGWGWYSGATRNVEPVALDTSLTPYTTACECTASQAGASATDSWNMVVTTAVDETVELETITVVCPTDTFPPGPPITFYPVAHVTYRYEGSQVTVGIQASWHPNLKKTRRLERAGCSSSGILADPDDFVGTSWTLIEGITYCPLDRLVHVYTDEQWCTHEPGTPFAGVYCRDRKRCHWKGITTVDWPEKPLCTEPTESNPHNSRDSRGRLGRTSVRESQMRFLRADSGSPREGWNLETFWGEDVTEPRTMWLQDLTLVAVYTSSADGHVYWTRSTDDGASFEDPVQLFMSRSHAHPFEDGHGYEVYAAYGADNIWLRIQKPGESTPAAEIAVKDSLAVAIEFEDDTFGISVPPAGPHRWLLSAVALGGTEPSEWESTDDGQSWEAV